MSKQEKLLERLLKQPKDFTWDELETLMAGYNYKINKKERHLAHGGDFKMRILSKHSLSISHIRETFLNPIRLKKLLIF